MFRNPAALLAAMAGLTAITAAANAQFVTSITRPVFSEGPTTVYSVDTGTGVSTAIFDPIAAGLPATAPGFTGLAADDANRILYASTTNGTKSDIYALDYTDPENVVATLLFSTSRDNGGSVVPGPVIDGLAFDTTRRILYATRVLGGSTGTEGLWRISLTDGFAEVAFEYEPTSSSNYAIGGIDYDADTDRIYLSDDDDTGGRNIYSMDAGDLAAGLTLVAPYPAGVTDVDGLGAGGGFLLLLSDSQDSDNTTSIEGNNGLHRRYNLATREVRTIPSPYPERTLATLGRIDPTGGGAYAPSLLGGPACPACAADFDQSGGVDGDDITAFFAAWQAGEACGDVDGSGGVDGDDIPFFFVRWEAGGC